MKIKKLNSTLYLLLFMILICTGTLITVVYSQFGNSPSTDMTNLKTSAGEIFIMTPENKTYSEPMSGYYPATYGFEDTADGQPAKGWNDNSASGAHAYIISGIGGHNKVLEIGNAPAETLAQITNSFSPVLTGTIEWWWRKSSTQSSCAALNIDGEGKICLAMRMDWLNNGKIEFQSGSWLDTGYTYADDTWIHMRWDFDAAYDNYTLWIDDVAYVINEPFRDGPITNGIDYISFHSFTTGHPTLFYVDAVGYSWDANYDIGDNLNEGLLLSFDTSFSPDWLGYSLDGAVNKTILGNTTIPMPSDGVHNIQVFGNDTMGATFESNQTYFTIDTNSPSIIINSPSTDDFISATAPNFDLTITGLNLDTSWYTIDDDVTNITFTGSAGTINQTEWDKKGDGLVTIRFYALDYAGNENSTEVNVNKDSTYPSISITSPSTDEYIGATAPNFDITITESNLVSSWYTIDDGLINITFTGSTGTINQTEWDKKGDGPVTIRFYAEDITGLENFAEVVVQKDTTPPLSILSFTAHEATNIVITSTTFTLTADDGAGSGVSLIRYKINDSSWIPYSAPFTLSGYDPGEYLITYQAIDNLGNTETEKTRLIELISISTSPDIPGYNLFILLGIISIIGIGLIRKRLRN